MVARRLCLVQTWADDFIDAPLQKLAERGGALTRGNSLLSAAVGVCDHQRAFFWTIPDESKLLAVRRKTDGAI